MSQHQDSPKDLYICEVSLAKNARDSYYAYFESLDELSTNWIDALYSPSVRVTANTFVKASRRCKNRIYYCDLDVDSQDDNKLLY